MCVTAGVCVYLGVITVVCFFLLFFFACICVYMCSTCLGHQMCSAARRSDSTCKDRLKVSPPSPPPPFPFICPLPPLVISFPHLSPPLRSLFVTAIVTCGCLSPTMHCNPVAPMAGGGTAVTSTERGEVRRRASEGEWREKKGEKMTHYSIGNAIRQRRERREGNAHLEPPSLCIQRRPLISAQMNLPSF